MEPCRNNHFNLYKEDGVWVREFLESFDMYWYSKTLNGSNKVSIKEKFIIRISSTHAVVYSL